MKKKKSSKQDKILISVVVPAYNEEKNIVSCLQALKKQNFPRKNYEIIVVNNNSTDKTSELASVMKAKVILETKKGITFALKRGFEVSKGQIIAVTDADTITPQDWLEKINKAFQENPSLTTLSGRIFFEPRNFMILFVQWFLNVFLLFFHSGYGCNFAIRKKVYQKIGMPQNHLCWETSLNMMAKKYGKIDFLWHNPVDSSSRHFQGKEGLKYVLTSALNSLSILLFRKAIFLSFISDVRN